MLKKITLSDSDLSQYTHLANVISDTRREEKGWGNQERLPGEGILMSGQDLLGKDGPKMQRLKGPS